MADRRRHEVRIGIESPASHSSIASNITTANSTTNPPAQCPRQPVNGRRIPRSIDNQYILTTVADGRLGYALPSSNGCVRAPQGCVLLAWANSGRTKQYPVNLGGIIGRRCIGLGGVGEGKAGASRRRNEESWSLSIFRRRRGSLRIWSQPHLHCHLNKLPFLGSTSICTKLAKFRLCQPIIVLKHTTNASIVLVVRAQSFSGYVPDFKFYKVEAIMRQDFEKLIPFIASCSSLQMLIKDIR
ncbi:hypothetical protein C1H46_018785 [Malus baccata]|uniref:Uncharacterized protein n=1 Tax=Malus baccata TaxID=106549 RepID=A0A540MA67_MALBA|nr:hypothetical protein C1H46_018785 [Malus baccata]